MRKTVLTKIFHCRSLKMLSEKVTSKWRCKRDNPETFWSNDSPENQENISKGPMNEYDKLHNKERCKF